MKQYNISSDDIFKQVDDIFKEADKVFKQVETVMEEAFENVRADTDQKPWVKWFAWRPVKVHGKVKWLRQVYRREIPKTYATYDDWTRYEYGTLFDVIKDSK